MRGRLIASVLLILAGCGGGQQAGFTVPRGATVSIKLDEAVATNTHTAGSPFVGEINNPIRDGLKTYVPIESEVRGVVEVAGQTNEDPPTARLSIRLTGMRLPNGSWLELDTVPVVRESVPELRTNEVTITTGLDVDLAKLLGEDLAEGESVVSATIPRVEIPQDSALVFTLQRDIVLPEP